jgi:hypothetical protein
MTCNGSKWTTPTSLKIGTNSGDPEEEEFHVLLVGPVMLTLRQKIWLQFSRRELPFVCNKIPAAPTYGVNISQLIQFFRACGFYHDSLGRELLLTRNTATVAVKHQSINQSIKLTRKLLNQGFSVVKLKSSLLKFYGRLHDLVNRSGVSVSQMTTDMFRLS